MKLFKISVIWYNVLLTSSNLLGFPIVLYNNFSKCFWWCYLETFRDLWVFLECSTNFRLCFSHFLKGVKMYAVSSRNFWRLLKCSVKNFFLFKKFLESFMIIYLCIAKIPEGFIRAVSEIPKSIYIMFYGFLLVFMECFKRFHKGLCGKYRIYQIVFWFLC